MLTIDVRAAITKGPPEHVKFAKISMQAKPTRSKSSLSLELLEVGAPVGSPKEECRFTLSSFSFVHSFPISG